jgi:hypothetical protein
MASTAAIRRPYRPGRGPDAAEETAPQLTEEQLVAAVRAVAPAEFLHWFRALRGRPGRVVLEWHCDEGGPVRISGGAFEGKHGTAQGSQS